MDKCKDCKANVSRQESICWNCQSRNIERKDDSKRLFAIKSESELTLLTETTDRVLLLLSYYPWFDKWDFSDIQIDAYEIRPNSERQSRFRELMKNYYYKIYLEHIKKDPSKTPAPKNFWPFSYQFYLCNPIKTFSVLIKDYDKVPVIDIQKYIEPWVDRSTLESEKMPIWVLKKAEINELKSLIPISEQANFDSEISLWYISEKFRAYMPLRDTDKISSSKNPYERK